MLRPVSDRPTFDALRRAPACRCGAVRVRVAPVPVTTAEPRVAYALTRRVGGAVVRNRIRRRLRSVMADLAETEGPGGHGGRLRQGVAYLVSAEAEAAVCPYPTLVEWVSGAVAKAHQRVGSSAPARPPRPGRSRHPASGRPTDGSR